MKNRVINTVLSALLLISICLNVFVVLDYSRLLANGGQADDGSSDASQSTENGPIKLIAQFDSKDIAIYSVQPYGVLMSHGGDATYFDWQSVNGETESVKINVVDYDADGKEDIALIIQPIGGIDADRLDELHILKVTDVGGQKLKYTDNVFTAKAAADKFMPLLNVKQSDDKATTELKFDDKSFAYSTPKSGDGYATAMGVNVGRSVAFEYERMTIKVTVSVDIVYDSAESATAAGNITGYVNLYGKFTIGSFQFNQAE